MLCKHTPETVIDVLLFAIARQIVVYHDAPIDMLIGVVAIVGLFAAKKYLIGMDLFKK
jgi:phosphate starvation-inducible membrane PsiE